MAKEKIKVSVIIDKEAVKKLAFKLANSPKGYQEVEKIIDKKEELVRDYTEENDEKVVDSANNVFGKVGIDIILSDNKDLIMSKEAEEFNEKFKDVSIKAKAALLSMIAGTFADAIKKNSESSNHDEKPDNNDGDDNGANLSVVKAKEILKSLLGGKEE